MGSRQAVIRSSKHGRREKEMKHINSNTARRLPLWLGLTLVILASTGLVYAQIGGGYDLSWSSVDGGGGTSSSGGIYSMGGTIGQPDAGEMSGGAYALTGGFWGAAASTPTAPPTNTPTRTPTPGGSALVGHVTWQGRPAPPNSRNAIPITLTLRLQSGGPDNEYASLNTDNYGFFTVTVGSLPTGAYNWRVKDPKYLATSGSVTLTGAAVTNVEMGLQLAGDADNNNVVNTSDFTILKGTFGKTLGDPGYDDRADFDGSLVVNASDFNLLKSSFGIGGAPPIGPGSGGAAILP